MSTKETCVGNDAGVSRYDIRENERHNRRRLSVFSRRRKRPKERETYARRRERLRTRLRFSSDFASPPGKSFSPIEIRKHAKERKKERTNDERSFYIVLTNDAHICRLRECIIARAVLSVSRSYSSRDGRLDAENDFVQIPS